MNIQNDVQGLQQILAPAEVSAERSIASPAAESDPVRGDQVDVSTAAYLVSQTVALPDVRMGKVAEVQAALANGTYTVSSSDVAGRVLDYMQTGLK